MIQKRNWWAVLPNQNLNLLPFERDSLRNKKTIYRLEENICEVYIWIKDLYQNIKHFQNAIVRKLTAKLKKWAQILYRHFTTESILMADKYISHQGNANLIPGETPLDTYLKWLKTGHTKYWQGCEGTGTLRHCWWKCKMEQLFWKTVWQFLFIKYTCNCCMIQSSHSQIFVQGKWKHTSI